MKDTITHIFGYALVLLALFGMYSCTMWQFDECKKVGHSTLYCIYKMGK